MRNRYDAFLYRVLESVMASGNAVQIPSVLLKLADHFARRKHTFSLCLSINVVYFTQLIGKMQIQIKLLAAVLVLGMAFAGGYRYAAALYVRDIAALREDYAEQARILEEKYRATEQKQTQVLVAAWQERDAALARADRLSGDVERVRKQAADARRRLSAVGSDTCDAERKQLARCADLLERGTELVRRGVELSERTAIDKDAVVKIVSQ